jgi:hypothetical protein
MLCVAGDVVPSLEDGWTQCEAQLAQLGLAPAEADKVLRRAHAWGGLQAYWRRSKEDEQPQPKLLAERIVWLRACVAGDSPPNSEEASAALRALLLAFPEAVGCDLETVLKPNVQTLQRSYGLSTPAVLAGVLARKPQVLGNVLDCSGDCVGECNRCW